MHQENDHTAWLTILFGWLCWLAGHVTLSNVALTVSIVVGLLQGYKTLREIRRQRRLEDIE
jgi:heme exporter protein D